MEADSVWPLVFDFFHLAQYFLGYLCCSVSTLFLFVAKSSIVLGSSHFMHPFISWWTFGLFPPFGIMQNAAVYTHLQVLV